MSLCVDYRSIYKIHFFILYNRDKAGNQLCAVLLLGFSPARGGAAEGLACTLPEPSPLRSGVSGERRQRRMFNSFPADVTSDGEVTETRPQ